MKTSLLPALAIALALSGSAFAQTTGSKQDTSQPASPSSSGQNTTENTTQNPHHASNILTINKLKQDLQNAGFTDVKILEDSFVVQAKDKDGNPTIMSLSPSGVVAFSELSQQQKQAKASNTASSSGAETQRH